MHKRLQKAQREALLRWVGEGLRTDEINGRAATFDPPFEVKRSLVDHYRKTRAHNLDEIEQAGEYNALSSGLAVRATRVEKLQALADKLEADLMGDSLWTTDVKQVAGELVYVTKPNQAWVSEYRQLLAQIAEEVGDKKADQLIPSEITVRFVKPEGQP